MVRDVDIYLFTSDEHYYHKNIITYADRPFKDIEEMNETLIERHNRIADKNSCTIHAGDFSFSNYEKTNEIIQRLNGKHIFLRGSHDRWLLKTTPYIWERRIDNIYVVVCHYAMRTWPRSHYGSIQLYGHSHGRLKLGGKQMDVGVDTNNFYPYTLEDVKRSLEVKNDYK
jgi:calcineurin-like phosphoesterase family protein